MAGTVLDEVRVRTAGNNVPTMLNMLGQRKSTIEQGILNLQRNSEESEELPTPSPTATSPPKATPSPTPVTSTAPTAPTVPTAPAPSSTVAPTQEKVPSQILTNENILKNESTDEDIYETTPAQTAAAPAPTLQTLSVQSPVVQEDTLIDPTTGRVVQKSVLEEYVPNRLLPSGPIPTTPPREQLHKELPEVIPQVNTEVQQPIKLSIQEEEELARAKLEDDAGGYMKLGQGGGSRHSSLKKYKKSKKTKQSKKFKTNKNHKNKKSKKRLLSRKNKK